MSDARVSPLISRWQRGLVALLLLTGTVVRLAPLTSTSRLVASVSEDGYLMLTVARNLADGLGMSTAAGTVPTNGVQPLLTLVWAGAHALTTSTTGALQLVVVVQWIISLVAAWFVGRLARDLFRHRTDAASFAALSAAAWYASPVVVRHTTNGLETGLTVVTTTFVLWLQSRWRTHPTLARSVSLGMVCGLAVLTRIDAAFLVAACCLVGLFTRSAAAAGIPHPQMTTSSASASDNTRATQADGSSAPGALVSVQRVVSMSAIAHVLVVGVVSVLVASPWFVFNVRRFGHVVPISGQSQSLESAWGENLVRLPRVVAEYALGGVPLPDRMQHPGVWPMLLTALVLAYALVVASRRRRAGWAGASTLLIWTLFVVPLMAYYGIVFAAGHFLSRYLFALSIIAVPALVATLTGRATSTGHDPRSLSATGLCVMSVWVAIACAGDWQLFARGAVHPHMHVVRWVQEHVNADTWVAAPQSGTLGYFHPRTINLDGKVNPLALDARRHHRLFTYVAEDTPVQFIADWYGLARWLDDPDHVKDDAHPEMLRERFGFRVKDPTANLVVLERRP